MVLVNVMCFFSIYFLNNLYNINYIIILFSYFHDNQVNVFLHFIKIYCNAINKTSVKYTSL